MPAPALHTEGLAKSFGRVEALQPLDLEVAAGEVVGYLGPNGAGKTTTLRLILGMLRPSAGRAEIFGVDAHSRTVEAHRSVAYVPGEASLWPQLTGAETLHLLARVHGRVDLTYRDELIELFGHRGPRQVRHVIEAAALDGRRGFVGGTFHTKGDRPAGSFVSAVTLTGDGLIESYAAYASVPAVGS